MRRLALVLLLAASRTFDRLSRAATHLAAGLTGLESLRAAVVHRWSAYALDDEHIDSGLFAWESAVLPSVRPGGRILIVGCGTGRDVVALEKLGYSVVGIDPAERAVDIGRSALAARGLSSALMAGFFEERAWEPEFDAVWFSYFTYSLIPTPHRVPALRRASAALRPGGCVILSVFRRHGRERLSWLASTAARMTRNAWIPGPGDSLVSQPETPGLTYEHFFTEAELHAEAAAAGLRVVKTAQIGTVFVLQPSRPLHEG